MVEPAPVSVPDGPGEPRYEPPAIVRGARSRFHPPTPVDRTEVIVARRNLLGERRTGTKPALSREHRIAGNLPAWDPLPENEQLVRRQGAPRPDL